MIPTLRSSSYRAVSDKFSRHHCEHERLVRDRAQPASRFREGFHRSNEIDWQGLPGQDIKHLPLVWPFHGFAVSVPEAEEIEALYFASTTQPYAEKQSATTIGWGSALRTDIFTVDCADSLRAGTNALRLALDATKAGSAKRVAVVAADNRLAQPRSASERIFGDGAAALVLGNEQEIATIDGHLSLSHEIMDTWRSAGEGMVRSWEDRFRLEMGFIGSLREAVAKALEKFSSAPAGLHENYLLRSRCTSASGSRPCPGLCRVTSAGWAL